MQGRGTEHGYEFGTRRLALVPVEGQPMHGTTFRASWEATEPARGASALVPLPVGLHDIVRVAAENLRQAAHPLRESLALFRNIVVDVIVLPRLWRAFDRMIQDHVCYVRRHAHLRYVGLQDASGVVGAAVLDAGPPHYAGASPLYPIQRTAIRAREHVW